jgi:hypothetical protein
MLSFQKPSSMPWVLLAVFVASPLVAQDLDRDDLRTQPYIYGGVGAFPSGAGGGATFGFGGGADWLVYRGLGIGVDATIFGNDVYSFFVGSLDISYHIIPSSGRLVPFVVAGIGFGGEGGSSVGIASLGAGVNVWTAKGMAVRIQVRARVPTEGGDTHVGAEIGLTF